MYTSTLPPSSLDIHHATNISSKIKPSSSWKFFWFLKHLRIHTRFGHVHKYTPFIFLVHSPCYKHIFKNKTSLLMEIFLVFETSSKTNTIRSCTQVHSLHLPCTLHHTTNTSSKINPLSSLRFFWFLKHLRIHRPIQSRSKIPSSSLYIHHATNISSKIKPLSSWRFFWFLEHLRRHTIWSCSQVDSVLISCTHLLRKHLLKITSSPNF